ncbi:unnamed protein product [Leptidea sinapis]|uniref:Plus3 domain-containing protein n=1 Tax=Leptidea sinapis TaxID=189913 RepID=A0A5E4QAS3_9NEOP|nr:unnamed protein product [Leptidea sinapis]
MKIKMQRGGSPLFGAKSERKRNVDSGRLNAMAALRAQRDARVKLAETKQRRLEQQRDKDKEDDDADAELIGGSSKQSVKLKASDIYSDDSGSDSEDNKSQGRRSSSSSSSSEGEEEDKRERQRQEVEVKYADSTDQINKLRLSRLVHLPFFARVVNGCFTAKDANKRPPTMDFVRSKISEVKDALMYEFKEEDVEKIVAEKDRFRSHPTNYAMKKTQLMKERDVAQLRGDDELVMDLNAKLQELEDRASQLDKTRTSSIQSISYINNRNRKLNVETAEKAIMEETDDPFTRRHTKPELERKEIEAEAQKQRDEEEREIERQEREKERLTQPQLSPSDVEVPQREKNSSDSTSLYSLHDFDINIDIDLPVAMKESGPKRSLNLDEYKKRHGLI